MDRDQPLSGAALARAPAPGFAIWLTGLPASGKTTVAQELCRLLQGHGVHAVLLDSDELRAVLTPQARYTAEERDWFYSVLVHLASWLTSSGVNVVIAATANRRSYRSQARAAIRRFAEVYVRCSLTTCQSRDPKGIYQQATSGRAATVPGVGADYEPPLAAEATVDTEQVTARASAMSLLEQLKDLVLVKDRPDG
jgi:adenylylsulfate kinase